MFLTWWCRTNRAAPHPQTRLTGRERRAKTTSERDGKQEWSTESENWNHDLRKKVDGESLEGQLIHVTLSLGRRKTPTLYRRVMNEWTESHLAWGKCSVAGRWPRAWSLFADWCIAPPREALSWSPGSCRETASQEMIDHEHPRSTDGSRERR